MNGDYINEVGEKTDEGDDLLAELKTQAPGETGDQQPTTPPPALTGPSDDPSTTHIIPHTESLTQTTMLVTTSSKTVCQDVDFTEEKNVTGTLTSETTVQKEEGEGVLKSQDVILGEDIEMTPLDDMDKK